MTPLSGLRVIETNIIRDTRGRFERLYCAESWNPVFSHRGVSQVNISTTIKRGSIRGMHFQQAPALEAKLIRCIRGHVFDVAVDLRSGSPTFLQWHALELRENEPREVFIPEGFAHGFQALSSDAQLVYFHTAPWSPGSEGGIRHDDPRLAISWPLPVTSISERDRTHPLLDEGFKGVTI